MKNHNSSVGRRIKAAREKASMTQSQLAEAIGYSSPTAISLIEDDKRSVRVDMLERFAQILHSNVDYLATGNESSITSYKTALRADSNFDAEDVDRIENYIDYLMSQKGKSNGSGREKN